MAISRSSVQGGPAPQRQQQGQSGLDQMGTLIQNFQRLQQNQQQLDRLDADQRQKRLGPLMEKLVADRGGVYNFLQNPEGKALFGEYLTTSGLPPTQAENVIMGISALEPSEQDLAGALITAGLYDKGAAEAANKIFTTAGMTGAAARGGRGDPRFTQELGQLKALLGDLRKKVAGIPDSSGGGQGKETSQRAPHVDRDREYGGQRPGGGDRAGGVTEETGVPGVSDEDLMRGISGEGLPGEIEKGARLLKDTLKEGERLVTQGGKAYVRNLQGGLRQIDDALGNYFTNLAGGTGRILDGIRRFGNYTARSFGTMPEDLQQAIDKRLGREAPGESAVEETSKGIPATEETLASEQRATQKSRTMNTMAGVGSGGVESGLRGQEGQPQAPPDEGQMRQQQRSLREVTTEAAEKVKSKAASSEESAVVDEAAEKAQKKIETSGGETNPASILNPKEYKGQLQKMVKKIEDRIATITSMGDPMSKRTYQDMMEGKSVSPKRLKIANERVLRQLGPEFTEKMVDWFNTQTAAGTWSNSTRMRMIAPQAAAAADQVLNNIINMENVNIQKDRLQLQRDQFTYQKGLQELQMELERRKAAVEGELGVSMEMFELMAPLYEKALNTMLDEGYDEQKVQEMIRSNPLLSLHEEYGEKLSGTLGLELTAIERQLGPIAATIQWFKRQEPVMEYQTGSRPVGTAGGGGGVSSANVDTVDRIFSGTSAQ